MLKVDLKLMNETDFFFLSKINHSNLATDHQFALLVIRILKEKMLANRDFVTSASCVPDA